MKKYPKKIPWSEVENIDLQSIVSNAVEQEFAKRRREEYAKKPYMDLSARKEQLKDHTKVYKGIIDKLKTDLHSKDSKTRETAYLKLHDELMTYTGRPLKEDELYKIIIHCGIKNPRMSMNAFGGCFSRKVIKPHLDIETK